MTFSDEKTIFGKQVPPPILKGIDIKDPMLIGMSYPLQKNPERGYFSRSVNAKLVNSGIRDAIKTVKGERFMLPDYGCNLRNFLFEPLDEGTFLAIRDNITTTIRKYLKKVTIGKLQVTREGETGINVFLYCGYDNALIPYFRVGVRV